ncbi:MAG: prepilin-type N-terminal cleavage/methylation domain-containing protein [Elusimicrobia bacterium]|nr:prepilin-type N-terminal cleavage/methylation domain-containing protein [Elusimicrobiota bacterium]
MKTRAGGFSLAELLICVSLISLVLLALFSVVTPILQAQIALQGRQRAQAEALIGLKSLSSELAQATEIDRPPAGGSRDALSGCSNYSTALGAPLDPSAPVRTFYFCVVDGSLYRLTGLSCPQPPPQCGVGPGWLLVANKLSHEAGQPAYFTRPARRNTVEVHYSVDFTNSSQAVDAAIAVEAAAGGNQ